MDAALSGLKVLDLSRILAGPWAGQLLADLGAEVVKVEQPGSGDDTRRWGPPYMSDDRGEPTAESAYFMCANRGKKSVCIDIKSPQGQAKIQALVADADIVIENFKTGGAQKYGLDYDRLSSINPRIIYCSITGFGQTGPYATRPGYDFLVQAMGGLMSITGQADGQAGAGPQKVGVALTDIMTGLYATVGILAAVNERNRSGKGQAIDLALLDVTAATLANQATNYLVGGQVPERMGNAHPNIVPYQSFQTADGYCIFAVGNDSQFTSFVDLLGRPDLALNPLYVTNKARVENRQSLIPQLEAEVVIQTTEYWIKACEQAGVPAGPINTVDQVFANPQINARGMRVQLQHSLGNTVEVPGNPIKLSRTPVSYDLAPPLLGEHTDEILSEKTPKAGS
ncbi:MAG: CaiB/BaiF CoA-transferase family protein [Pseudomonadales bacterium]